MTKKQLMSISTSIIRAYFCRTCFPDELGNKEPSFKNSEWFEDLQKLVYYRLFVKNDSMLLFLSALLQTCEALESKHRGLHKDRMEPDEAYREFCGNLSSSLVDTSVRYLLEDEDSFLISPKLLQCLDNLFPLQ